MCALCAALGRSNHWTNMAGRSEFESGSTRVTRRDERARRNALLKKLLGYRNLEIDDWGGSSWLISDSSGAVREVYQLDEIWYAADELSQQICDPLDPDFLGYISGLSR